MDSIDISDPAFSLGISDVNEVVGKLDDLGSSNDSTIFIYLGALLLVLIIGMFVYKFYMNNQNKSDNEESTDCPGGFCMRPNASSS